MSKYKPYWEKLKDPRWQKMRLKIMSRDEFSCCDCGEMEKTLNVHHTYYERAADPWDYPMDSLLTLCETCHGERHAREAFLSKLLAAMSAESIERITGYALAESVVSCEEAGIEINNVSEWHIYGVVDHRWLALDGNHVEELNKRRKKLATSDIKKLMIAVRKAQHEAEKPSGDD